MLGYMCEDHGYQSECGVDEYSGARICQECGMEVTGLVGRARSSSTSPPTDQPGTMEGDIEWRVTIGYGGRGFHLWAFDYLDAIEQAIERVDNPQSIRDIEPAEFRYGV